MTVMAAGTGEASVAREDSPVRHGVLFDVDGVLRPARLRQVLRQTRGLLDAEARDRRSVLGMPGLLRQLAAQLEAEMVYVTAAPPRAVPLVRQRLAQHGYPPGLLVCTSGTWTGWLLGRDRHEQRQRLAQVLTGHPARRWVLVGDDGRQDPTLFTELL